MWMLDGVGESTRTRSRRSRRKTEKLSSLPTVARPPSSSPSHSFCLSVARQFSFSAISTVAISCRLIEIKNCILYKIYILFCERMWSFELLHRFLSTSIFRYARSLTYTLTATAKRLPNDAKQPQPFPFNFQSASLHLRRSLRPILAKFLLNTSSPSLSTLPQPHALRVHNQTIIIMATTAIAVTAAAAVRFYCTNVGRNVDKVKWFSYLCSANLLLIFGENFFAGTAFRIINFSVFDFDFFFIFIAPFLSDSCVPHSAYSDPTQLSVEFNKLSVQRCLARWMDRPIQPVKILLVAAISNGSAAPFAFCFHFCRLSFAFCVWKIDV